MCAVLFEKNIVQLIHNNGFHQYYEKLKLIFIFVPRFFYFRNIQNRTHTFPSAAPKIGPHYLSAYMRNEYFVRLLFRRLLLAPPSGRAAAPACSFRRVGAVHPSGVYLYRPRLFHQL